MESEIQIKSRKMGDFFNGVCFFDYRGFCKKGYDCLKKHFQEICKNKNCHGDSCLKQHPKLCIFFTTFGDCKFGEYCRYLHERKDGNVMVELEDTINKINQFP